MQIQCLLLLLALVPLITAVADVKSKAPAPAAVQSKSSDADSLDIEAPIQEKSAAPAAAPAAKSAAGSAKPGQQQQQQKASAEKASAAAVEAEAAAAVEAESDEVKRNNYGVPQYGNPQPAYVSNPVYEKPSYSKPVYSAQPTYSKPTNNYVKPSYSKPVYTAPAYEKPSSYNSPQPSYNPPKPVYNDKPVYNQQPAYPQAPYNPPQYGQQYGNDYQADTLLQTNVIFRLGDRTPFWLPRNDYYKEKDFPEGLNQLINVGKERLVNYGRLLRQRYQNLLHNIKLIQISAESASTRVNIESALSLLAGLAPPTSSQVWSTYDALASKWQPIAVNSVEEARDWKLNSETRCRTAELVENVTIIETVPQLKHFLSANREVIRRLEVLTGEDFTNNLSWIWIANVYDTYLVEAQIFGSKFYPPRWADAKTLAVLKQANDLKFSVWGHDPAYLKLRGGLLVSSIVENLVNAGNGNDSVKVALYATDDINVAVTEHILGIFSGGQPGYGAGVILELHRGDGSYGHEPNVHVLKVDLDSNNYQPVVSQVNLSKSPRFAKHCYGSATCSLSNFAIALHDWQLSIDEVEQQCNNQ